MDRKLLQQAVELTEQIMTTYYYQRDIYAVLDRMAPDATWIGPGEREKKYVLSDIKKYFELGRDSILSCEVANPDLRAIELDNNNCIVTGSMTIRTLPGSELVLEVDQRVSFTFRYRNNNFEVVHMHISNPYGEMGREEYFPHKMSSQSYQYLQRLLNEKTEVLDMITGNINGGLKGSNDDSMFSYYYVNEGLPQMLGYTYNEFMDKSGGTAVGAVYPPDLQLALADCERCFSQGPVYSTEYRMEKKDGTLIWVLDSGRKTIDSEGISRINSILTDITPLKNALFDLEVEQERYRIALEHTVGVMCEYEIANDIFTLYLQLEENGINTIQQKQIEHFSKLVDSEELTNKQNGEAFLSLCTGKSTGTIEFLTHLPYQDKLLHWVQFSCSVITNHSGSPVRALGLLKDITEEKERNLELLKQAQCDGLTGLYNQTTIKDTIQDCLIEASQSNSLNFALLMLDLDNFKNVNDLNGHACGDDVLIKTAEILKNIAGKKHIVGRMGGDEFLVLVKDTNLSEVEIIAEIILKEVRKIKTTNNFPISCSIGIAYPLQKSESFSELYERVDKALYNAKNEGGDRVSCDCISS